MCVKMTMLEIAKKLGVSQSTVSRALNGNCKKISAATVERIRAKAAEVGFVANRMAINLRSNRSNLIGVMLPQFSANKYELGMAICQVAQKHNLAPLFSFYGLSADERCQALRSLISQNIAGLITLEANLITDPLNFPVINLFNYHPEISCFTEDYNDISKKIFSHLEHLGHRTIAYIGMDSRGNERVASFKRYQNDYILEFRDDCCFLYNEFSEIFGAIDKIVSMPELYRPTAIILSTDFSAFAAISYLKELGFSVPNDFSIVSYNDQKESKYFDPPLTTIRIDQDNLAERIIHRLFAHIEDPNLPRVHELLKGELIVRKSTAPNQIKGV